MRAKHVLNHFNLRARAKLVWSRITLSRLTTLYFAVAAIHCIVQIILQGHAFAVNASAADSLWELLVKVGLQKEGEAFAVLSDDLRLCYQLPKESTAECQVVWSPNGTNNAAAQSPEYAVMESASLTSSLAVTPVILPSATTSQSSSAAVQTSSSIRTATTGAQTTQSSSASRSVSSSVSEANNVATSVLTASTTVTATVATVRIGTPSSSPDRAVSASSTQQSLSVAASSSAAVVITSATPTPTQANAGKGVNPEDDDDDDNDDGASVASDDSDDDSDDDESDDEDEDEDEGLKNFLNSVTGKVATKPSKRELTVQSQGDGKFTVSGLQGLEPFEIGQTCIQTLIYPVQKLSNTKREDITLIGFQFWVLTMSFVAILNESIPHLSAALVTQLLVAVWTAIQVTETESFRKEFFRLVVNGACRPHNLLVDYWQERVHAEIASAVLNGVATFTTGIMTYKLIKVYSWQTYKRIGASLTINRVYKLVLCLSMAIQLALFFIVATAGLWVDQLYNGSVAHMSHHRTIYQTGVIVMACFLPPWLSLGWFAIRREWRVWSLVFLALNLAFLTMWALQFDSNSFRWTLILWRFFSLMAVISGLLLLATLGLGLACRLNFGKGLPSYLNFQDNMEGVDFAPVYPDGNDPEMGGDYKEKIDFPSSGGKNESANFADQQAYSGYSYNNDYSGSYGSYGSTGSYGSFGTSDGTQGIRSPERVAYPTHIRTGSQSTVTSLQLERTATQSSHVSQNSVSSFGSNGSRGGRMGKRWVIE